MRPIAPALIGVLLLALPAISIAQVTPHQKTKTAALPKRPRLETGAAR